MACAPTGSGMRALNSLDWTSTSQMTGYSFAEKYAVKPSEVAARKCAGTSSEIVCSICQVSGSMTSTQRLPSTVTQIMPSLSVINAWGPR